MPARDIDRYLERLDPSRRAGLEHLRRTILAVAPAAEQGIAWGMPVFRVNGKIVGGFAAFKQHLSYFPHSGRVLDALGDEVAGYVVTRGALHFGFDERLPTTLVKKLIAAKVNEPARGAARKARAGAKTRRTRRRTGAERRPTRRRPGR